MMMKNITKKQAEKALATVTAALAPHIESAGMKPVLQEPGFQCSGWAIAFEGGLYDWPVLVASGGVDDYGTAYSPLDLGPHIFAEPVNGCVLGLYPAWEAK